MSKETKRWNINGLDISPENYFMIKKISSLSEKKFVLGKFNDEKWKVSDWS
jgi:hypothetical protein